MNGIGGKVEPGEQPLEAMRREFNEEAGLDVAAWRHFATIHDPGHMQFTLHCYWATGLVHAVRTMEAEKVSVVPVEAVLLGRLTSLGNLPWLVAMARAVGWGEEATLDFNVEETAYREGARL